MLIFKYCDIDERRGLYFTLKENYVVVYSGYFDYCVDYVMIFLIFMQSFSVFLVTFSALMWTTYSSNKNNIMACNFYTTSPYSCFKFFRIQIHSQDNTKLFSVGSNLITALIVSWFIQINYFMCWEKLGIQWNPNFSSWKTTQIITAQICCFEKTPNTVAEWWLWMRQDEADPTTGPGRMARLSLPEEQLDRNELVTWWFPKVDMHFASYNHLKISSPLTCCYMNHYPFGVVRCWITGVVARIRWACLSYYKWCYSLAPWPFVNHNCAASFTIICDYLEMERHAYKKGLTYKENTVIYNTKPNLEI